LFTSSVQTHVFMKIEMTVMMEMMNAVEPFTPHDCAWRTLIIAANHALFLFSCCSCTNLRHYQVGAYSNGLSERAKMTLIESLHMCSLNIWMKRRTRKTKYRIQTPISLYRTFLWSSTRYTPLPFTATVWFDHFLFNTELLLRHLGKYGFGVDLPVKGIKKGVFKSHDSGRKIPTNLEKKNSFSISYFASLPSIVYVFLFTFYSLEHLTYTTTQLLFLESTPHLTLASYQKRFLIYFKL
jgi:hypothetical protein